MKLFIVLMAQILSLGLAQADQPKCTNFSGFWEGQCTDNLQGQDKSFLAIEQLGCEALHLGPHPIVLGTATTTEWAGGAIKRTENINWTNAKKTVLAGPMKVESAGQTVDVSLTVSKPSSKQMSMKYDGTLTTAKGSMPYHQVCNYKLVKTIKGDQ